MAYGIPLNVQILCRSMSWMIALYKIPSAEPGINE